LLGEAILNIEGGYTSRQREFLSSIDRNATAPPGSPTTIAPGKTRAMVVIACRIPCSERARRRGGNAYRPTVTILAVDGTPDPLMMKSM
jgi:hypothetical protein